MRPCLRPGAGQPQKAKPKVRQPPGWPMPRHLSCSPLGAEFRRLVKGNQVDVITIRAHLDPRASFEHVWPHRDSTDSSSIRMAPVDALSAAYVSPIGPTAGIIIT